MGLWERQNGSEKKRAGREWVTTSDKNTERRQACEKELKRMGERMGAKGKEKIIVGTSIGARSEQLDSAWRNSK